MDKIILSDTSLLGLDYQDTNNGINYLKRLQAEGCKVITLSNRPELCMRKIGAYLNPDFSVSYHYLGACDKKGNGIDLIIHDNQDLYETYNIKPDFSIFGNGICAFDKHDNLIYQGEFLSSDQLEAMIKVFREYGYRSYNEYASLVQDAFGDRCFQGQEDVYKFFTPEIGSDTPNNRTYGMQCSSRGREQDKIIIEQIERIRPEIVGYILNSKPCFYQKRVNKLNALNTVLCENGMSVSDSFIILSEKTDKCVLEQYPEFSECVGELSTLINPSNEPNSLARVLKKVM